MGHLHTWKKFNKVQLFLQTQVVHTGTFSPFYFMHIEPVKFTPVNVGKITQQWKSSFT